MGNDLESWRNEIIGNGKLPRICLVCHKAYGALHGGQSGHIGGVEWQVAVLAKWLARRGYVTTVLTWTEGGSSTEIVNGIKVIKIASQNDGVRGIRFFHPKWTGLARALRQADCDIYYHHGAECVTGQVALWCALNHRKFVFSAASDTDCDGRLPLLPTPWERMLFRFGLRKADVRVTQTETQQQRLERDFGLDSTVLRYAALSPSQSPKACAPAKQTRRPRILWLARVCEQKRPDRLLDLAEACPEFTFDFVGPVYSDSYAQSNLARARQISNVTVHGPVSREDVGQFYQQAAFFCCTSDYEGFPNTFLEAWSYGLPVISTFDPDKLIQRMNLGFVVASVEEMRDALRLLTTSAELYASIANNAREYFLKHHTFDVVLPQYEQMFARLFLSASEGAQPA